MTALSKWSIEWPLYAVVVAGCLYAQGGRMRLARAASFYAGLVAVVLAVDSPIDTYAGRLFWVHMVQHVVLTMVAPPLLLLGRPWPRILRPFPLAARRRVVRALLAGPAAALPRRAARRLASPMPAFALFSGTLLLWHLPALYDLTLRNGLAHDAEHGLFVGTALLLWTHLLPGATGRPRLTDAQRVAYATGAIGVGWVLAVVLGLAPDPVYSAYASLLHRPGGISALADQQLAAGVMWVPGSVPFCIALLVAIARWLDPAARRAPISVRLDHPLPKEMP